MRFAAFETSTEWCSVALWLDGEICAAIEERAGHRHARAGAADARAAAGAAPACRSRDLEAVAFGAGPGRRSPACASPAASRRALPSRAACRCSASPRSRRWPRSAARRASSPASMRAWARYIIRRSRSAARAGAKWSPAQCVAPAAAPLPPGEGWVGCGNGFAAYGDDGAAPRCYAGGASERGGGGAPRGAAARGGRGRGRGAGGAASTCATRSR